MSHILLGITSSIAAFKVLELAKELKKKHKVDVIMTENASKILSPKEFEKITKTNVAIKTFREGYDYNQYLKSKEAIKHISLADKADILVIAPATANIIAKLAFGLADDLLSTTALATNAPILICPAMNCKMWQNPIVQHNIQTLKSSGHYFIEPESGMLACGYEGPGRLANIKKIETVITELLEKKLKGKLILVTAGATEEEIDPVRVITNKSSGKMGIYIAEQAAKMGAKVTLIRGKTEIEPQGNIKDIKIKSANELFNEIKKNIKKNDIIIHAAAVSDFSIDKKFNKKIESSRNESLLLRLKKTKKIINEIKKLNKKITLVGFKAEYKVNEKELIGKAYSLLNRSNADFIVANDVSKGTFGSEYNEVYIIDKNKKIGYIKASKREIAERIIKLL